MVDLGVPNPAEGSVNAAPRKVQRPRQRPKVDVSIKRPKLKPIEINGLTEQEVKEIQSSREAVSARIAEINDILRSARKPIRFRMPGVNTTDPIIVEVIDPNTREVIRTIPSDRLLRIKNQLEVMMGLVFDGEA